MYEYKIVTGYSLNELEKNINTIANLRREEINKQLVKGNDVDDFDWMWFKPCSSISFINNQFMIMSMILIGCGLNHVHLSLLLIINL